MPNIDAQPLVDLYIEGNKVRTENYLQSLQVRKKLGFLEGTVTLFDPAWTYLESFILDKGRKTKMKLSYGWSDNMSNLVEVTLFKYRPTFEDNGIKLEIDFILRQSYAATVKRNVTFDRKKRISDIVQEIANKNGWEAEIEPTRGTFDQPLAQRDLSDIAFIKNVLMNKAVNGSGVGGYRLNFEGNKLYFHTPGFGKTKVYKTYVVNRDPNGEVISFSPRDQVGEMALLGARNLKIISFDPREKETLSYKIDHETSPEALKRQGGKVSAINDGDYVSLPNRVIHSADTTQDELERHGIVRWCDVAVNNYEASATLMGDPFIPVFSNLEFIVVTTQGQVHYLSGNYQVKEVTDDIENGEFTSSVEMFRTSSSQGSEEIKGVEERLIRTTDAPGYVERRVKR